MKHKISVKYAEAIGVALFTELNIDLMPSIDEKESNIILNHINKKDFISNIYNLEIQCINKVIVNKTPSLEDKVKFHFEILKWIEANEGRLFTIAPLCSSIPPFVELCTKAVEDLYKFSISTNCKIKFTPDAPTVL